MVHAHGTVQVTAPDERLIGEESVELEGDQINLPDLATGGTERNVVPGMAIEDLWLDRARLRVDAREPGRLLRRACEGNIAIQLPEPGERLRVGGEARLPERRDRVRVPAAVAQLGDDLGRVRVETEPITADPERDSRSPGSRVKGLQMTERH